LLKTFFFEKTLDASWPPYGKMFLALTCGLVIFVVVCKNDNGLEGLDEIKNSRPSRNNDSYLIEPTWLLSTIILKKFSGRLTMARNATKKQSKKRIVNASDYRDKSQELLYQTVRFNDKSFAYRRPNPENPPDLERRLDPNDPDDKKHWLWEIGDDTRRILYHLSRWLAASKQDWQIIVEGEKDVETLERLGLIATTNPMGAGKWNSDYNKDCAGRLIAIVCDHDEPGERHGLSIANSLHGITKETRLIFLDQDLPKGTDVTDLVEKHNWTAENFSDLIDKTPAFIPKETGDRIVAQRLSDVEPVPVQWLWFNRFALGKLCLLAGNPDVGKSFASLDMAARISTGNLWPDSDKLPDGSRCAPQGTVLILTAEDGLADTVRPRLDKMEADCKNILAIEGVYIEQEDEQLKPWLDDKVPVTEQFSLSQHISLLEKKLNELQNVKLIIIDPLSAYYGTKTDTHKNAAIRSVLTPIAKLAEQYNVCIIGITHLRKSISEAAMFRVTGSIGQIAAARMSWLISVEKENKDRRLLTCLKNNLSREKAGLAFRITDGRIEYEPGVIIDTADDVLQDESEHGPNLQEAIEFLNELLIDDPTPKATDVLQKARKAGISERTLRRAKAELNIESKKHRSGHIRWERPEQKSSDKLENETL